MIKILNILTDTNIGGAGRLLVNYLHCHDREKFLIKVVLPVGSELKPLVEAEGYEVIEMQNGRDKSFDLKAVSELVRIIKAEKPDIVHCHSAFSGKLAAFLCGIKRRFYTRHCAFEMPRRLTTCPGRQINGFVNNTLATDIVAVAQAAADNLTETGVNPQKITVIINGVEPMRKTSPEEQTALKEELGIGENTFVCGISARLEPYKGHMYLLDTVKEVTSSHPDSVFLIIGGGSEEANLKNRAAELGIADRVRFTGFVPDVAPYYNIMDLNLNCSVGTETSSLALSEGMSLSVPAVVSNFGGNPYMITDGVNGFVVPWKDPHAMSVAICRIMDDPELHRRLRDGAYSEYKAKFTAAAMTKQLENLYLKEN
ncbi:MAG: glycosyltransferase [Ruminococcaceae bacterium]|nr:glycosyltransferase [Oscillospiraceae bacterium]